MMGEVYCSTLSLFVQPHFELNLIMQSPITKKATKTLRKFRKNCFIYSRIYMQKSSYQQKLIKTYLMSLREKGIQEQLTIMFKMKRKHINWRYEDFSKRCKCNRTLGNVFKLTIPHSESTVHKGFFSNNVCNKHQNNLKYQEISEKHLKSLQKRKIL